VAKTLEQMMKEANPAQHKKIERRAAQFIAEQVSLRELRRANYSRTYYQDSQNWPSCNEESSLA
jgi:hypothetical protein